MHNEPKAWRDVLAERQRQVEVEGFTQERDDEYAPGDLAAAGAAYAAANREARIFAGLGRPFITVTGANLWPWSRDWWKPKDRRHDLVRAAALIIAEIEKLDRAADVANG